MKPSVRILCTAVIAIGFINFFAFIAMGQILGNNRWHALSLIITHPLMLAGMFYLLFTDKFPKMIFRGKAEERLRKEKAIVASGSLKASFSCAGKIGLLNFGGPLLQTKVYPQGIHFKPFLMPAFGILENEMKSVQVHKTLFKKGVEITHTSPEIASPIYLQCANNAAAIAALTAFIAQPSPFG